MSAPHPADQITGLVEKRAYISRFSTSLPAEPSYWLVHPANDGLVHPPPEPAGAGPSALPP